MFRDHREDRYSAVTATTTSAPGASARLLRAEMYRLMKLDEPAGEPVVRRPSDPRPDPSQGVRATLDRRPAAVALDDAAGRHLVVDVREPEERLLGLADVLVREHTALDPPAAAWTGAALTTYPGCLVAAAESAPGEAVVRVRDEGTVRCRTGRLALAASAVHAWLADGRPLRDLPPEVDIIAGPDGWTASFSPPAAPPRP
ncbi:hypothetical protein [Actinomadura flavalba]|uniref:hypothetical protein n=1 Tax=Actinomadura flavalba TaxID=1120938 RepID=UPI0012DDC93F|nr:hypothetical protein [Actinomadura flavalba]